jgi:hypothetical protein
VSGVVNGVIKFVATLASGVINGVVGGVAMKINLSRKIRSGESPVVIPSTATSHSNLLP